MLKTYVERESRVAPSADAPLVSSVVTLTTSPLVNDDGDVPTCAPHLSNSSILGDLGSYLMHLSEKQFEDVCDLIQSFPSPFSDVPSRTSVLYHDIEVESVSPVKHILIG